MTIKIYASALDEEPIETHKVRASVSVYEWLSSNVEGFASHSGVHPLSVYVNDRQALQEDWPLTYFDAKDDVRIVVEPKGIGVIIAAVVGVVVGIAGYLYMRRQLKGMQQAERPSGSQMGDGSITANSPKLGQPIPEIAGSPRRFPDYLLPPYRRFAPLDVGGRIGLKSEQFVSTLLCVGQGNYVEVPGSVLLGDTKVSELGDKFSYSIHGPNTDLTAQGDGVLHEWWHSPSEVGFTSFGGAGIELQGSEAGASSGGSVPEWGPDFFSVFNTDPRQIVGNPSTVPVPAQWRVDMTVSIRAVWPVEIGHTTPGHITCEYLDRLGVVVGDTVTVLDNPLATDGVTGVYTVVSIVTHPSLKNEYLLSSMPITTGGFVDIGLDGRVFVVAGIQGANLAVYPQDKSPDWLGFPESHPPGDTGIDVEVISIAGGSSIDDGQGWQGWFSVCPPAECADAIELDFILPQGWGFYSDEGRLEDLAGAIEIQVRPDGDTSATPYTIGWHGATPNQYGFSHRIEMPTPGRWQVRCRTNPAPRGNSNFLDRVQWSGLKARIVGAPDAYPGVTVLAANLRAGDSVGSNSENRISLRATRVLKTVENEASTAPTRSLAPFLLYVLESVGYSRDLIDMTAITENHAYWQGRADTFDAVLSTDTTAKAVANQILAAGFGELTIKNGKISAVIDKPRDGIVSRVLSPHMLTAPLVESTTSPQPDDIDGVDVEYLDYETSATEVVQYRLPGDQAHRVQKVNMVGVTDFCKAFEIAARIRRTAAYRRTTYTGETELQAMNLNYLDYIGLQDGTPELGQSAYVVAASGNTLTLSEPVDASNTIISFVRRDGTATEPQAIVSVSGRTVTLAAPPAITLHLPGTSQDPTIAHLGTLTRWMVPALVMDVEPGSDGRTKFAASGYDPRVYEVENCTPPDRSCVVRGEALVMKFDAGTATVIFPATPTVWSSGGVLDFGDGSPTVTSPTGTITRTLSAPSTVTFVSFNKVESPTGGISVRGQLKEVADWFEGPRFYTFSQTPVEVVPNWLPRSISAANSMFSGCPLFNQKITWDTSRIRTFSAMFLGAASYNQPVTFDTSGATSVESMFAEASSYNQPIDLDLASCTSCKDMFYKAESMNSPINLRNSSLVEDFYQFLRGASVFNNAVTCDLTGAERLSYFYAYCPAFNQPVTINAPVATDIGFMFAYSGAFNSSITLNAPLVTNAANFLNGCSSFNQPITFDLPSLKTAQNFFKGCTVFNQEFVFTGPVTNVAYLLENCTAFNKPVPLDMSRVTISGAVAMFRNCINFNQDLSGWCVPLIASEPGDFSTNTPAWNKINRMPVWGTCP